VRGTAAAGRSATTPGFAVGAALDDPSQGADLQRLGLRLARIGVLWPVGAAAPDPSVVAALQRLPAGIGAVLQLIATPLPVDDGGRAALAQYATALATQTPGLQSIVLEPAPTAATATNYAAAFAQVRAAVQAALPDAAVGIAIDGSLTPKTTLAALGAITPDIVAFHPAPAAGKGLWATGDLAQLQTALSAVTGTAPPVLLDGPPVPSAGLIGSLACGSQYAGVLLDKLTDATPAVAAAAASAQRGAVVCPGVAAEAQATTLTYPSAATSPVSVQLGCDVDCLYLVTLDAPNGRPVVARRGALRGGAAAATVTLPKAKLGAGPYRVGVRLVAQVNPGPVTQLESPPLTG
jgi:hypothetical protein